MPAPRTRRPARPRVPTTAEQHAEWLGLLRPDGPYLSVPVLAETLPHGLETIPDDIRDRVRRAWSEVQDEPDMLGAAWLDLILAELLRYPANARGDGTDLPSDIFGAQRPDLVMYGPAAGGGRVARLHVYRRGPGTALTTAQGERPALSEVAAQVCRTSRTPLALLTNGQDWVLVHARPEEATGIATFDADLWLEEQSLLRAFATLLAAPRVLAPPMAPNGSYTTSLAALFARSIEALTTISTTLGEQVRQAVELFVSELARLDRESGGVLLAAASDREIYRAALTVLMRIVFLLYAEEQRLLPVNEPLYARAYAASTLYDDLEAARSLFGDEIGDRRTAAWPRLMALFGAVHGGCEHPDLRVAAHGGSLFDPQRFPWLARTAVSDRVVHEMLDALLVLRHRGKAAERLSYKGLDVEQIGHVYEGLLEYSCIRITTPHLGLIGRNEPEIAIADLESHAIHGDETLSRRLLDLCGLTPRQLRTAMTAAPSPHDLAALHAACDNNNELSDRIRPYWGLLRTDLRGLPTAFPAGSILFTRIGDRRATGTHYTPRSLAEEVVEHALAPLCFASRPTDRVADEREWQPKTATDLLNLKVLDPAMGSGAFLVSACRYLAGIVVRAWERDGVPADVLELAGGDNHDDLLLAARRLVAARCLYGVDRDDMAVELSKLSLWLVTLAKNRPFGFVDHALRCGDSLIGITSTDQLTTFHLIPAEGRFLNANLFDTVIESLETLVNKVAEVRESIEATVVQDPRDAADKAAALAQARKLGETLTLAADAIVGAALTSTSRGTRRNSRAMDSAEPTNYDDRLKAISSRMHRALTGEASADECQQLRAWVDDWLRGNRSEPVRPMHWPLEFPEVVNRGGFDAIVGNPPFVAGTSISSTAGRDVLTYIQNYVAHGRTAGGRADLCCYFLLREAEIGCRRLGVIATNTIAQGDSREVALDRLVEDGWIIYRANKSQTWPGTASVQVSLVWMARDVVGEIPVLDGHGVSAISSMLRGASRVTGNPFRLKANADLSFKGCEPNGMGFVLSPQVAQALITAAQRNREVLAPFLNGDDLNSTPDCTANRWVIDFFERTEEEARQYPDVFAIVERHVKPERQRTNDDGSFVLRRPLPQKWWQFADKRAAMREAIAGLGRVLAIVRHSTYGLPVFVSTEQVISDALIVIATNDAAALALLTSTMHFAWWTEKGESTLETRLRYTPSDGFDTFAWPAITERMSQAGEALDVYRRSLMVGEGLGVTDLYNLVHNPSIHHPNIDRLRELHVEIDETVADAYGWSDLALNRGFYDSPLGTRYAVSPDVKIEMLDRLLELNHQRHAEEEATAASSGRRSPPAGGRSRPAAGATSESATAVSVDGGLFPPPDTLF